MVFKSITLAALVLVLSASVNAAVVNTLNGVDYEWLELTETAGMSRDQVEADIAAASPGDLLYGYNYASRVLLEDLFLSYAAFDGLDGWHGLPATVDGTATLLGDFGVLTTTDINSPNGALITTVDGFEVTVQQGNERMTGGLFGSTMECGISTSCVAEIRIALDFSDIPLAVYQLADRGWDATSPTATTIPTSFGHESRGSFLVRVSEVPVPAAAWLFGSGLICLIRLARRKA